MEREGEGVDGDKMKKRRKGSGRKREEGDSTIYSCTTCVEFTCLHYTVNVVIILHQVTYKYLGKSGIP